MTLFDPSPKSSVKDLYGRENELRELIKHITERRWVVLLGPRRIGKTSLARCALSKISAKHVVLDAGEESDLGKALVSSLSRPSRVSGLQVGGGAGPASASFGITRDLAQTSLGRLLESAGKTVILIDEAQWLRNPSGVSRLLAHIYDYHYDKITLIITGSAVGVMKSILEPSSKSAFYGRAITTMEIQRWEKSTSFGFLKNGCKESHVKYTDENLFNVVDRLDGMPGWLTLYGYHYALEPSSEKAMKKTIGEATKILHDELENVSSSALGWKRKLTILRELSKGTRRFSDLGSRLGINNTALSHNLEMLHRLRYVSKQDDGEYVILDPLVSEYIATQTP